MCVVSNVGDKYSDPGYWPNWPPSIPFPDRTPPWPRRREYRDDSAIISILTENTELKRQLEQMKKELEEARAQDIAEGNPDCEMDDKVVVLKKIAKIFGIELNEVFPDD